ncbi:MAG: protein translocase subunit SecF [Acidimicrobiaceae bacterium]|nr:protein translocase subunit SecF [Acidimicrobiaceae bacterium]
MKMLSGLYSGESALDFPRMWRRAAIGSAAAVFVGLLSFVVLGLNLGLDFEGGTSYEVQAPEASVADVRSVLADLDATDARVQLVGDDRVLVRSDVQDPARAAELREGLEAELGEVIAFEQVGPTWGDEVTDKAVTALLVFFVVVALYIAVRLEWKMAVGALVAVAHDIVLSVGVYSVFRFEITPATVIAFLTIMGYSLYDTIVVYDKVREIVGRLGPTERYTYRELMNLALNRVAMRSINTSITSAIPVVSMLLVGSVIMGAATLREFAVALLVGIVVGSYSSLFVASALVARMKEREDRWRRIGEKVRSRADSGGIGTRVIDRSEAALTEARSTKRRSPGGGPARRRPPMSSAGTSGVPPRPRKKKR